jgi:Rieske Fe-S protein
MMDESNQDRAAGTSGGSAERSPNVADCPESSTRRRFCQVAIGGTAALSVAAVGYPIITFLRLPQALGPEELMEVPMENLVEGYAYWGEHRGRQIVVIRLNDEIRAFDGMCTHLSCIVHWESANQRFLCPCHGAAFDDLGNPMAGPVNMPLRRVDFVIEDNVLKIRDSSGRM